MSKKFFQFLLPVMILLLVTLACGFSVSSANIEDLQMARDPDGLETTTVFNQDDGFYAVMNLKNAPEDTLVKAVWTAVDVEGAEPDYEITATEITTGSAPVYFELTNPNPWPTGSYQVEIYLNDELQETLAFEVR